jgi:hypothetical protein
MTLNKELIKLLSFVTEADCVDWKVRMEPLNMFRVLLSFKVLYGNQALYLLLRNIKTMLLFLVTLIAHSVISQSIKHKS